MQREQVLLKIVESGREERDDFRLKYAETLSALSQCVDGGTTFPWTAFQGIEEIVKSEWVKKLWFAPLSASVDGRNQDRIESDMDDLRNILALNTPSQNPALNPTARPFKRIQTVEVQLTKKRSKASHLALPSPSTTAPRPAPSLSSDKSPSLFSSENSSYSEVTRYKRGYSPEPEEKVPSLSRSVSPRRNSQSLSSAHDSKNPSCTDDSAPFDRDALPPVPRVPFMPTSAQKDIICKKAAFRDGDTACSFEEVSGKVNHHITIPAYVPRGSSSNSKSMQAEKATISTKSTAVAPAKTSRLARSMSLDAQPRPPFQTMYIDDNENELWAPDINSSPTVNSLRLATPYFGSGPKPFKSRYIGQSNNFTLSASGPVAGIYKYRETIRKKSERKKLHASDCACCSGVRSTP